MCAWFAKAKADDPKRGYYQGSTYDHPATPREVDYFKKQVLAPVLAGSDEGTKFLGSLVTGNGSGQFAEKQRVHGDYAAAKWYVRPRNIPELFVTEKDDAPKIKAHPLPRLPAGK